VAEVAVTAVREESVPGLGLGTRDQAVPFQCKISVFPPGGVEYCPTAHALAAEVAVTPRRAERKPGLGLGTRDQAVPFQCKISV